MDPSKLMVIAASGHDFKVSAEYQHTNDRLYSVKYSERDHWFTDKNPRWNLQVYRDPPHLIRCWRNQEPDVIIHDLASLGIPVQENIATWFDILLDKQDLNQIFCFTRTVESLGYQTFYFNRREFDKTTGKYIQIGPQYIQDYSKIIDPTVDILA